MKDRVAIAPIKRLGNGEPRSDQDLVAVESPLTLEIRQTHRPEPRSLGVLMRTPGDDRDLVLGLLYAERVIRRLEDVIDVRVKPCLAAEDAGADTPHREIVAPETHSSIEVELADDVDIDTSTIERASLGTSACGLCGRLAVGGLDVLAGHALAVDRPKVQAATITSLPAKLREGQTVFAETGGLHAAGLFDAHGHLLAVREDVGRHNAVDKLVGAALSAGWLPARETILAVSGRVAYEIVQKTIMAGVPILVAVGAPSSLAIEAARAGNLTLVGFVREGRFNVYSGMERLGD